MPGHARRHSAVSCTNMAEPIEMPFGLWTRVSSRKHVLHGVTLAQPSEYQRTVRVRRRCDLSNYFDHLLQFACVVDDAKCIVVTRVCVSVCLSAAACPHYCTDPAVTWGSGRGCPLVVHYWADLQSVHGLRCYGNNANPNYKLASIPRYDDIVRTLGEVSARCWPVTGG